MSYEETDMTILHDEGCCMNEECNGDAIPISIKRETSGVRPLRPLTTVVCARRATDPVSLVVLSPCHLLELFESTGFQLLDSYSPSFGPIGDKVEFHIIYAVLCHAAICLSAYLQPSRAGRPNASRAGAKILRTSLSYTPALLVAEIGTQKVARRFGPLRNLQTLDPGSAYRNGISEGHQ